MKLIDSKLIENISCDDVTENDLQDVFDQSKEMYDLIKYERKAIGIAAPQVGIFKKFFIYKTSHTDYTLVINPVYVKNGPEIKSKESCLSYGINNWKVIKRFKSISTATYKIFFIYMMGDNSISRLLLVNNIYRLLLYLLAETFPIFDGKIDDRL